MRSLHLLSLTLIATLCACAMAPRQDTSATQGLQKIKHFIVLYQENWSFDGLYGKFPGANGIANAGAAAVQVDRAGKAYATLPQPLNMNSKPADLDSRFPSNLENGPFDLSAFVEPGDKTGDLTHRFYQEQYQINGGKMNMFAAWSEAAGLVMSYYDASDMPEGRLAKQFTLADNFFHSAFGGSFLNHFWLICACTPVWAEALPGVRAQLDVNDKMAKDGQVTPDGYAVNTAQSMYAPHSNKITDPKLLMPAQTAPTIGDRLSEKGVSWTWYAGGWNDALAGNPHPLFQFHHQPFVYFKNFGDGTPAKAEHLKDEQDFLADLRNGTLPAVSFVKPLGTTNEHPGYADLKSGQEHIADLVNAVQQSRHWKDAAIIITYDENGGRWDHVAPPKIDNWGPGTRVPAIIVSPHAKKGFVDHTQYETVSILRTLEKRFGLAPLSARDAAANDLFPAFDFSH